MIRNTARIILTFSLILGYLTSCQSSAKKDAGVREKPENPVVSPESSRAYEFSLPGGSQPKQGWPLLVAIDPHGSGETALQHLKKAADEYPAVLVASNRIQNNDPNFIAELNELIAEVRKRYPVGDRVYLAGFSGGARMALAYASNHPVAGVIACGAFASPKQLSTIQCPVIGLIGMDDFNFSEAAQYFFNQEGLPPDSHIELTRASHEWPDEDRLADTWGWFQLPNESPENKNKLTDYLQHQQQRIDSLTEAGNLLQAACLGRNMGDVPAFNALIPFRQNTDTLVSSEAYQQRLAALGESLQTEIHLRQQLTQALFQEDKRWWKDEIASMNEHAESEPDLIQQMSWKRLIGFLGIVCYSYSRQFIASSDAEHLEQVLMVYRLAEPNNPDMLHFSEQLEKLQSRK